MLLNGKQGNLCCEGPSAFIPAKTHTPVASEASQEPAPSEGCKAKVICRECWQLLTFSTARNTMERNRRVQLVPSMAAASCRAELTLQLRGNHPKHIIWYLLLHLLLEEHWHSFFLCVCSSPKCLCRGLWQIRRFLWDISCASLSMHVLWAQMTSSGLWESRAVRAAPSPSTVMVQEHASVPSLVPCQNGS